MNTKDNRRSQQTDENIVRAFYRVLQKKKTVNKVTVRELCEEAGVNRSTFYAHFQDVYDLLEQVEKTMARSLTQTFLDHLSTGEISVCFVKMFEFIGEYRDFYRIYLNETNKSGVIDLARELYSDKIPADLWKQMGMEKPEELPYHEAFAVAGITAIIRHWLNTGCKESPHELSMIFFRQYSTERNHIFDWAKERQAGDAPSE